MARKKRGFEWMREDQEGEAITHVQRRDQTAARAERRALEDLAQRLVAMPTGRLTKLPLDEETLEALAVLARQGPKSSRRRQLLRVQAHLRPLDIEALEAAIAGATQDTTRLQLLERWRRKLIEGGDDQLQAFVDAHPTADRQRLRALTRQSRGQGPVAARAARRLFQVMKEATPDEGPAGG